MAAKSKGKAKAKVGAKSAPKAKVKAKAKANEDAEAADRAEAGSEAVEEVKEEQEAKQEKRKSALRKRPASAVKEEAVKGEDEKIKETTEKAEGEKSESAPASGVRRDWWARAEEGWERESWDQEAQGCWEESCRPVFLFSSCLDYSWQRPPVCNQKSRRWEDLQPLLDQEQQQVRHQSGRTWESPCSMAVVDCCFQHAKIQQNLGLVTGYL